MTLVLERVRAGIKMRNGSSEWTATGAPGDESASMVFDWQDRIPRDEEETSSVILVAFPISTESIRRRFVRRTDEGTEVVREDTLTGEQQIKEAALRIPTGRAFEHIRVVYKPTKPSELV